VRAAATLLLAGLCLLLLAGGAGAVSPPANFIDTNAATGLSAPTSMVWDAGSARLFVTEQGGDLRVVKNGALLGTAFVHLTVDSNGERGLLGVALDPMFSSNHFLYVYYTVPGSPPHNRVSRFTAAGDVAAPGSEAILLELNNLSATNHNGGAIHFGKDGKLYIAVGENANGANSQTLSNLLGKLLRMNSDGSIPTDNPFYGTASGQNRLIWALGLRNPFTFAVQPGTGRIFINDVGQSTYEEIDDGIAGSNYGWPITEGPAGNPSYRDPISCYRHVDDPSDTNCRSTGDSNCAITGGDFYNPPVAYFPAQYVGRYLFFDLCGGWIDQLIPSSGNAVSRFATGGSLPVDIDTGPDGSLYYLERGGSGRVGRISYRSTPTVSTFAPMSGAVGTQVTIQGTYLAGATAVRFHGTPATFSVVWDTRLIATVPAGATSGTISLTTGAGTATSAGTFTVPGGAPTVSSFNPTSGPVGTSVVIHGTNFSGATAVKFHGTNAQSFTVNSGTQITAVVAAGTTSGTVSVTGPGGTGTSVGSFTVTTPPTISGFTPTSGPPGTTVTINGDHFTGATAVKFHGTGAKSYTVDSDIKITAVVKVGSTTGTITVTTPSGTGTSAGVFTVPPPPAISSFSPTQGKVGTTVTILGSAFTGATAVKFHGTNAKSFVVKSSSKIVAVVKTGTTTGPIAVISPNGKGTSAGSFTVLP
jgi:glucose/arabinose dehydrogenase